MTLRAGNLSTQTAVVATAVGAISILLMYLYRKRRKNAVPTTWDPVGKVKHLYIYPLKSGRRMELQNARCTDFGFRLDPKASHLRDRCLVVYKESDSEFRTARTYPKMVLISVTADGDQFAATAPGMEKIRFKVPNEKDKTQEITMFFKEKIFAIDCGDETARWFSRYILGVPTGLRLGYHIGQERRDITKTHQQYLKIYGCLENDSTGMYSDLTSYMLMNQASVDEVASRIPRPKITMHNFRPNIVVDDDNIKPFDEDDWDWVRIGDVLFRNVKPCTRCALTTIDPETGVKSDNFEPITTLRTYRKVTNKAQAAVEGDSPVLGVHLGIKSAGSISVGDIVYVGNS